MHFAQLQDLLDSVAPELDPAIDYIVQLRSGGYRTPNRIKQADSAEQIQRACGLLLADADLIWKAAGGIAGQQLNPHVRPQSVHAVASLWCLSHCFLVAVVVRKAWCLSC